jgi:hypothetical protein
VRVDAVDVDQPQRVARAVALAVEPDQEEVVALGVGVDVRVDIEDLQAGDHVATVDRQVARQVWRVNAQFGRQLAEEVGDQRHRVVAGLDMVQAIAAGGAAHILAAQVGQAGGVHGGSCLLQRLRVKLVACDWPLALMT